MKKLYYISSTDFAQVDMGFLKYLTKTFEVTYGVVIPKEASNFTASELEEYCKNFNIKFEPIFFKRRQRDARISLEFLKVIKNVKRSVPDFIYTVSWDNPFLSAISLTLNRQKTIVAIHDVRFHGDYPFSAFYKIGRNLIVKYFRFFQVFSTNQQKIFREKYPSKKLWCIPLPLSNFKEPTNSKNKQHESNLANNTKKVTFLFFGNILTYKGLDLLLLSINTLSLKYPNIQLVIAGRCNDWSSVYEPMIQNKDVVRSYIRHIKNEEIADLFSSCDYLVLPYRNATQSGPLMIAYNYNVPVIASNIDAFNEVVVEGTTGYFFNCNDEHSLTLVLESAINKSAGEYDLLKTNLRKYANDNFSNESIGKMYESMFLEFARNQAGSL